MITVQTIVSAPAKRVWECWTNPDHIVKWAFASDDWEAPFATNDLSVGGRFKTRMQSKDGKSGFDFEGTYSLIDKYRCIEYTMDDGRSVKVSFEELPGGVKVTELFDPESENPEDMQREGWQSILENFRRYVEEK